MSCNAWFCSGDIRATNCQIEFTHLFKTVVPLRPTKANTAFTIISVLLSKFGARAMSLDTFTRKNNTFSHVE